jgi:hypothetical protein
MEYRDLEQDGTHGFECRCGFESTGWPTKKARDERRREHSREHAHGEPMSELAVFRDAHGLSV